MSDKLDPITEALAHVGAYTGMLFDAPAMMSNDLVQIAIKRGGDFSGHDAEMELRRFHIPIWGRNFDEANLYFYVKAEQAAWAEYVLHRAGVEVTSAPIDPRNTVWAEGKGPVPAWDETRPVVARDVKRSQKRGWLARLIDWLVEV